MTSSSLDALERAFYDIHGEGHSLDTGDIRHALFDTLGITTDTPIGTAMERLDSARAGCIEAADLSLAGLSKLCSTYTVSLGYARAATGVSVARHDRALVVALRDELTLLELFAAESELSAAVDVS